jgi:hypothetical protein
MIGNVRITLTLRRVRETIVTVESNKYYIFVYVCAGAQEGGRVHACSLFYPSRNPYTAFRDVICGLSGCTIFFDIIL